MKTLKNPNDGLISPLPIREFFLENGLQLLVLEDHSAPVIAVQVWYRVGSRNEVTGLTGVSHLLEHMMFKGTQKLKPEEYSEILKRYGGSENAFTSNDVTAYFSALASSKLEEVLALEADRMVNLAFDEREFQAEREVVKEERRLGENNPSRQIFEDLEALAYKAHPYRIPVIGWMSDLENFTRDDLIRHYRTYYAPNNAFLIVVGDVEAESVLKLAKSYFGPIPGGVDPPRIRTREPEQTGERRAVIRREAFLPMVVMAYHIPEYSHPHASALKVLAQILTRGKASRLYKTLVYHNQIATSIGASAEDRIDPGLFGVTCNLQRGRNPEEAEVAIYQELERLQEEPVTDLELEKAVNQAVSAFLFGQESMLGQAFFIGRYNSLGSYHDVNRYVEKIQAVTRETVLEVAKRYFTQENRSVVTLIPFSPKGRSLPLQG